jgi:hypothetical protein
MITFKIEISILLLYLKAYSRSNWFFFFILKVANIRCFILIAVEIFHYIIRKYPRTNEIRRFLIFLYPLKNSMLTRTLFIYSVTYKVNLFGKAFAHVRHCLRKEKHMYGTNKNIDGLYTKTTQIWWFRVKIKKKGVIPTYSILQHVYGKHNLVSF